MQLYTQLYSLYDWAWAIIEAMCSLMEPIDISVQKPCLISLIHLLLWSLQDPRKLCFFAFSMQFLWEVSYLRINIRSALGIRLFSLGIFMTDWIPVFIYLVKLLSCVCLTEFMSLSIFHTNLETLQFGMTDILDCVIDLELSSALLVLHLVLKINDACFWPCIKICSPLLPSMDTHVDTNIVKTHTHPFNLALKLLLLISL